MAMFDHKGKVEPARDCYISRYGDWLFAYGLHLVILPVLSTASFSWYQLFNI